MTPLALLLATAGTAAAAGAETAVPPLPMATVATGADGRTCFSDDTVALAVREFAPPAPDLAVSHWLPAHEIAFGVAPVGWYGDWHPAPRRQFVVVMQGTFEIETGDGEKRLFPPGSVYLLTDTDGQGHRARTVGDAPVRIALIAVPA